MNTQEKLRKGAAARDPYEASKLYEPLLDKLHLVEAIQRVPNAARSLEYLLINWGDLQD